VLRRLALAPRSTFPLGRLQSCTALVEISSQTNRGPVWAAAVRELQARRLPALRRVTMNYWCGGQPCELDDLAAAMRVGAPESPSGVAVHWG
jgi:hypothetical protein